MDRLFNQNTMRSEAFRVTLASMLNVIITKQDIIQGQWLITMAIQRPKLIRHNKKWSLTLRQSWSTLANVSMTVATLIRSGLLPKLYSFTIKLIIDSKMTIAEADSNQSGFHSRTGTGETFIRITVKIFYSQDSKLEYVSMSGAIPRIITASLYFGASLAWYGHIACTYKTKCADMISNTWKFWVFDLISIFI